MAVIVYVGDRLYDDLTPDEKRLVADRIVRVTMVSFAEKALQAAEAELLGQREAGAGD